MLTLATTLFLAVPQSPPTYTARVLQSPPSSVSPSASRLNDQGQATGEFLNTATGYFDGVLWDADGSATVFSTAFGLTESGAIGIRDDGTVTGRSSPDPFTVSRAMTLSPAGVVTQLPSLPPDLGVHSIAFDMSDNGTVVGTSSLVATPWWLSVASEAVFWENGVLTSIGTLGGYLGQAIRVNESKRMIGHSNTATDDFARGFVWDPILGMREITPALPGEFGQVRDLDEQGQVCGSATTGPPAFGSFAVLWPDPDQPPVFLPILPGDITSTAHAMNEDGVIVGTGAIGPIEAAENRARLWWGGAVYDLNQLLAEPLPYQLAAAADVNEHGQILVNSEFTGSGIRSVILTPMPQLEASPASISIAAGGTQTLDLEGGSLLAGGLYLILGTVSGTSPGLPIGDFTLPLNPDPYFAYTVNAAGNPPLVGGLGTLDASGAAQAAFTLAPGSDPTLVGLQVHHAYGALNPVTGAILGASNAAPLDLLP